MQKNSARQRQHPRYPGIGTDRPMRPVQYIPVGGLRLPVVAVADLIR